MKVSALTTRPPTSNPSGISLGREGQPHPFASVRSEIRDSDANNLGSLGATLGTVAAFLAGAFATLFMVGRTGQREALQDRLPKNTPLVPSVSGDLRSFLDQLSGLIPGEGSKLERLAFKTITHASLNDGKPVLVRVNPENLDELHPNFTEIALSFDEEGKEIMHPLPDGKIPENGVDSGVIHLHYDPVGKTFSLPLSTSDQITRSIEQGAEITLKAVRGNLNKFLKSLTEIMGSGNGEKVSQKTET